MQRSACLERLVEIPEHSEILDTLVITGTHLFFFILYESGSSRRVNSARVNSAGSTRSGQLGLYGGPGMGEGWLG